ncbi:trigger factor [Petrocella sp. FN5]|uniref:trigger factor n=1 Tax=Petrocella sp. FN5 TaxID=3032002 RepID=UPI0023DAE903|nr:trigger factor [Petrocella sp. FN5]MDF1618548.1 trigger factor [Petrocella sp. FN5]
MNTTVEKLENSMVKLVIEVDANEFEKSLQAAYLKNRGKITIQGFRKGRAPRKLIEKVYGANVFYEDAANGIIPNAYDQAVEETGLEVMSRPEVDVEQIESGQNFIFTAKVAVKPEVTLGDYKGLEVEKTNVEVTDEDIEAELKSVLEKNSRMVGVVGRPVEMDDHVVIDFEGFVDGTPFAGGKAESFSLVIGSGSFIDTFEEQIIGKNIGETFEVNVTFPEDYQSEALRGKPAMFTVTLHEIKAKEMPVLDDEFAKDVSEFDTLAEYKEDVAKHILNKKEAASKQENQSNLLKAIIEKATMDMPEPMVELEAENMTYEFSQRLQTQGMKIEDYFRVTGQNMNTLKEQMKGQAIEKIKVRLVLEAIAKAENIEVTDEAVEAELVTMAEQYNMDLAVLKETIGEEEKESIRQDMLNQKALDLVVEASKEV